MPSPKDKAPQSHDGKLVALLEQAKQGDERALTALLAHYEQSLQTWANREIPRQRGNQLHGVGSSDIKQEAKLRAFRKFVTFQGSSQAEFEAWLRKIVTNQGAQTRRDLGRQRRDGGIELPIESPAAKAVQVSSPTPSQNAAQMEQWQRVLTFLFRLPDSQRQAIFLGHLKELPIAEVAKRMRRSEGAVAGLIQRGLTALHAHMTGESAKAPSSISRRLSITERQAADALLCYLRQRDSGVAAYQRGVFSLEEFVAQHPACADQLRIMLTWVVNLQTLRC
ncbi:RNA polymerase sigma factor [Haliangium sp. UPWRP_2]|uniref:RNA polymerase sigma factor n=1 Tax=Haliangium sp. UPWRP_2 TaxID=1931276 RepID=UPI000B53ACEE|nr:RNA polymerase sigma factor [Haliangium sp. UPWRP_2]PSM32297.1 hypothetical protein BVG81_000870 [Haliangium sp. UPWRP_2]